jgi:hypothetical protein
MTVYCGQCNTANRDGSLFCNRCGQRLTESCAQPCRNCGAQNLPGTRFCLRCGSPLPSLEATEPGSAPLAELEDEEEEPLEAKAPSLAELAAGSGGAWPTAESVRADSGAPAPHAPAFHADADGLLLRLEAGLGPGPSTPAVDKAARALPAIGVPTGTTGSMRATDAPPTTPGETFAAVVATRDAWSPPPAVKPKGAAQRAAKYVPRLLYVALLAAVLAPFLVPGDWSGSTIPLTPSTAAFFQTVAALRPGSPVLVAFEYDPSTQGEMDPQARVVLAHLMQRGARIAAVSTLPAGPAQAQLAFAGTATAQGYRYGADFINLGYLAGDEAALATLGQDITTAFPRDFGERLPTVGRPVLQDIRGVRDFALVVVLAAEERSALAWLTQVQARFGVRMTAGISAAGAAQMAPYLQSGQLDGLLTGLPGAAEYELLMNHPGTAVRMLDAQSLAHAVIVVFVLLGNLGALVWGLRRRTAATVTG